jgi:CRISPR-associated protein Csb2
MLTLEMELLTGVYRASLVDQSAAEWPPHPERVFSALVQAWGDGGEQPDERAALEWIEALPSPPSIEASPPSDRKRERDAPTVYVPPNDAKSNAITILPELRNRQERRFRAVVPLGPLEGSVAHVRFHWSDPAPPDHMKPLRALAHRVASVGHSSSLVRLAFREDAPPPTRALTLAPTSDGDHALRVTYPGRLQHLVEWHSSKGGKTRERPKTRATARYERVPAEQDSVIASQFGAADEWFILQGREDSAAPDILAFPMVARRVRDALMSLDPNASPEIICGHRPDRSPSESPHLAIVPLANVGWAHADGHLLGVGLVLPRAPADHDRHTVMRAIRAWMRDRGGIVRLTRDQAWALEAVLDADTSSLRADRFCVRSRSWASVTPVCLDRFLKGASETEEAELIARACTNVGLPEPFEIQIHKHSAVRGGETSYPARGQASRPDWRFSPSASYRDKPRRHVVLRFREYVRGPVILGSGRYHGMGLCLPIDDVEPTAAAWQAP